MSRAVTHMASRQLVLVAGLARHTPFHDLQIQRFLWLAGALGILRVSPAEIEKALTTPSYLIEGLTIGANDGLRGLPRQREPFPTAARAADGRLWFATTGGIAIIDPKRLTMNPIPPPIVIESIKADDRVWSRVDQPQLPARTRNIEIRYAALSLTDAERVRFRYKLDGYDEDWRGPVAERQVAYTNLPPDTYRFRLTASNNDGLWNTESSTLTFTILPAFYQTTWFRASLLLVLGLGGWAAYLIHMRQVARRLKLRYEERLAERERIARELHDTLLQGACGLVLQFQAVADQIPPSQPTRQLMDDALDRADRAIAEGRKRVDGLRTGVDDDYDLADAFTRVGRELANGTGPELKVIVEGQSRPLHVVIRDETYWIGREALINAFHWAAATHLEVELIYGQHELRFRCRDDGHGIDPAVLSAGRTGHWGMQGMRERATHMGGQLEISSRIGVGTEVDLKIPGSIAYRLSHQKSRRWFGRAATMSL